MVQDRAEILKIPKSTVENHLYQLGYVNRFDMLVPHSLSKKKKPSSQYFHMQLSTEM